jgi:hypothetical protein
MTSESVCLKGRIMGYVGKAAKEGLSSCRRVLAYGLHSQIADSLQDIDQSSRRETYVEEVQLIRIRSPNARRKKQQIPLLPCHFKAWKLKPHARTSFRCAHLVKMMQLVRIFQDDTKFVEKAIGDEI